MGVCRHELWGFNPPQPPTISTLLSSFYDWHHPSRPVARLTSDLTCVLNMVMFNPLTPTVLPYWYSYKASCARLGWAIICNFWHPGTLTLRAERQCAQMSKITHDGLTRYGTGCFIAVPIWQHSGRQRVKLFISWVSELVCGLAAGATAAAAVSDSVPSDSNHHIPVYAVSQKKPVELDSFDMSTNHSPMICRFICRNLILALLDRVITVWMCVRYLCMFFLLNDVK